MAGAVLVGLLLVGCGGDPGPQPVVLTEAPTEWPTELLGPSPTPHDSPSEEPPADSTPDVNESQQPPVWDPALNEPTVDNALAFGKYFMELYSYVVVTGDTSEWRELSHPECGFCSDTAHIAETSGFVSHSHHVEVTVISGNEVEPGYYYTLDYSVTEWADGVGEPSQVLALLGVLHEDDHWVVGAVEIHEGSQP